MKNVTVCVISNDFDYIWLSFFVKNYINRRNLCIFFSERTLEITEKKRRCLYLKEEITIRHSEVKSLEHRQRELHMHLFRIRKENNRLRNTINQLNKIVDDFR